MLKSLFIILAVVLSINYSTSSYAADVPRCFEISKEDLLKINEKGIAKLHEIDNETKDKFVKAVNQYRLKEGKWEWKDVQKFIIAELKNGSVGLALFDSKDCSIPGSVVLFDFKRFKDLVTLYDMPELLKILGRDA